MRSLGGCGDCSALPRVCSAIHHLLCLTNHRAVYAWLTDAEELLDEMHQKRLRRMVEEAEVDPTAEHGFRVNWDETATETDAETDVEMTDDPNLQANGGESDSLVEESETETTTEAESQTDETESSSLIDRLFGWERP